MAAYPSAPEVTPNPGGDGPPPEAPALPTQTEPLRIELRYEGRDADAHEIELHQLGESLQGFGRVIAVAAHFSQTGQYNK